MLKVNTMLKVVENILMVIFVVTIFIVAYNFLQLKLLNKDYVSFFGYSFFEVISDSMAPTLTKQDVIIIKKNDNYIKDSIITYKANNAFVTHRVIEVNSNFYLTRGDANNATDVPVLKEDVVGEVVITLKGLGIWRNILLDPQFLIVLIILVVIINSYFFKDGTLKEYNKNKFKKDFKTSHKKIIEEL